MDDLSQKINEIMSDPQALSQIKGLGEMLGLTNTSTKALHTQPENKTSSNASAFDNGLPLDTLSTISKFMPVLADINKEDDTTRLLFSLRPFLSDQRRKKLDEAGKIIKLMKLIPLIKDFNLLDSLF